MIALLQRVLESSVKVDDQTTGSIGKGLLLLVCAQKEILRQMLKHLRRKSSNSECSRTKPGKMNLSALDTKAEILVISRFTLAADTNSGNRASFTPAAEPALSKGSL